MRELASARAGCPRSVTRYSPSDRPPTQQRVENSAALRLFVITAACASACATPPSDRGTAPPNARLEATPSQCAGIVEAALAVVGRPYRWGGSSPQGFDCSGLVLYSYAAAGIDGLPHSARRLRAASTLVPLSQAEPGDLLFFDLRGNKTSHVAIYLGQRRFVHAPSSDKRVEVVSFEHVFWGKQLERASAGRIGKRATRLPSE